MTSVTCHNDNKRYYASNTDSDHDDTADHGRDCHSQNSSSCNTSLAKAGMTMQMMVRGLTEMAMLP